MSNTTPLEGQPSGTTDVSEPTITGPQLAVDCYGNPDHYYYECHDCGAEWTAELGRNAHDCTEAA